MPSTLQQQDETPVDRLLRSHQTLETPVVQVARRHDAFLADTDDAPARFAELIPLSAPRPGEQYAFDVNLDTCTGCKACVSACHSMNGLDHDEIWREVGLLQGGSPEKPYLQTVTTACHHCIDPACLQGCPVNAYEKDPITGIVLHLDDQCIGCQYCVLKCPYDVPKYSPDLGIVRKCDMCHGRLAEGEAPACVQACPNGAITITTVPNNTASATQSSAQKSLLPGTVDSSYTRPTTRYQTQRGIPANARPADAHAQHPEHPHWPLILMLTWTQLSVGSACAALFANPAAAHLLHAIALVTCAIGLTASIFHLGKPLKAWRAFLGLTHSWLSREIIIFGAYFPLLFAVTALPFLPPSLTSFVPAAALAVLAPATALTGLLGVFCSIMIYADTRRAFWSLPRTSLKFGGTLLLGGAAATLATSTFTGTSPMIPILALMITGLLKLAWEAHEARHTPLMHNHLRPQLRTRLALGIITCLALPPLALLPLSLTSFVPAAALAPLPLLLLIPAELTERYLYFRAVTRHKMPGL